jgi:hypothetical protein
MPVRLRNSANAFITARIIEAKHDSIEPPMPALNATRSQRRRGSSCRYARDSHGRRGSVWRAPGGSFGSPLDCITANVAPGIGEGNCRAAVQASMGGMRWLSSTLPRGPCPGRALRRSGPRRLRHFQSQTIDEILPQGCPNCYLLWLLSDEGVSERAACIGDAKPTRIYARPRS